MFLGFDRMLRNPSNGNRSIGIERDEKAVSFFPRPWEKLINWPFFTTIFVYKIYFFVFFPVFSIASSALHSRGGCPRERSDGGDGDVGDGVGEASTWDAVGEVGDVGDGRRRTASR